MHQMTNEQKVEAYRMRLEGATWSEISRKYNISKQAVCRALSPQRNTAAARSCVYPAISRWMQSEGVGYTDIARKTGISYSRIFSALTGAVDVSTKIINAIIGLTGLTYEAAFMDFSDDPELA